MPEPAIVETNLMRDPGSTPPTILIVEDELPLRRLLGRFLQSVGCRVLAAENGQAALTLIENSSPDIALVDVLMPVMGGREFLEECRSRGYQFPAVLVSASPEAYDICEDLACDGVIPKPYDINALMDKVRMVLDREPLAS